MLRKILATLFLFVGLVLIFQGLFDLSKRLGFYKPQVVHQSFSSTTISTVENLVPSKINLPSLSLDLPIEPTLLKDGKWPTSQLGVSFVKNSGTLGYPGNLIFYGHNWKNILGDLHKIKVGEKIHLNTNEGQTFNYKVSYIAVVDASDVSILADTTDERITLYTCTGFLDQKRLVIVAKRV